MSTFVHVPASRITGDLEAIGQRPGADSGDPQLGRLRFDTDGTVRAGVWESRPGGWPVEEREDTETCYILSGRAVITDGATGETFEISAVDVIDSIGL
ncbi:cupin domain-containing protein [Streptomyces massasporeus]|uniref:cupin domain-containing protein n=1 Tax=Streptomyces massasporeus TaxID=67324 RepID=UPI0034536C1B